TPNRSFVRPQSTTGYYTMKRRAFTRLLTLGAGSLGLLRANALEADEIPRKETTSDAGSLPREPVNVDDFRVLAQAKLPKATYDYISTGSGDEVTLRENGAAFQRLKVYPPLLTGVATADLSTTGLKQQITLPILPAPAP